MKELENGLTIVARESYGAPVVTVQVWVEAGAADEHDKIAGIAHMIEHMMFKGTEKRGVGQTALEVESLGGDLNAFTSHDHTVYYITLASRYFDQAMELISDLVRNPVFDEQEFQREREVVLEEISRGKDNPHSRIYKYLFAEAYKKHSYRRPVIGFEETVRDLSRDDLVEFFNTWYVPGKMTLVVAGKVDADEVIDSAERYFGDMPAEKGPSTGGRSHDEPAQDSFRVELYREDVSEGYVYFGFHAPEFASEDMPELDLLSTVIGGGETSRLTYRLRDERRLVNRAWSYAYTPKDPGLMLVGMNLDRKKLEQALEMGLKQLFLLKHENVEQWELEKAKVSIRTDEIYARETVQGQARQIGYQTTLTGDPSYEDRYLEEIKAVTVEDLKNIASKYLNTENLSLVAVLPEGASEETLKEPDVEDIIKKARQWDLEYEQGMLEEPNPIIPPEVPEEKTTPAMQGAPPVAKGPVKYVLSNGARLIVRENHVVPLVAVRAAMLGGVRMETPELNGINNFIAETMTEGTRQYSASQLHSFFEARGAGIQGFAGRNSVGLTLEAPSPYFDSCLPLFNQVLREPAFPEDDVERIRGIILSTIRRQLDQPRHLAFRMFRSELFHEHPYGMDVLGTEKSVSGITRQDLVDYYQKLAAPENLVIAVVGDVNALEVKNRFEELFRDFESRAYSHEPVPAEPPVDEPRRAVECREVNQANMIIGFHGARLDSDGRYHLEVLSSVLSGMSGRLFTKLRGKQGLAYSVFSFSQEGLDPGMFGVYIGTAPEKEDQAREGILSELKAVRESAVTEEELSRSRKVLIGDFEIGLQRFSNQAAHYALDELYGLGYKNSEGYAKRIESVSAKDVQAAARQYLEPGSYVMAVVKPCGEDEDKVSRLSPASMD